MECQMDGVVRRSLSGETDTHRSVVVEIGLHLDSDVSFKVRQLRCWK